MQNLTDDRIFFFSFHRVEHQVLTLKKLKITLNYFPVIFCVCVRKKFKNKYFSKKLLIITKYNQSGNTKMKS